MRYGLRLLATTLGTCLAAVLVFGLLALIASLAQGNFSAERMKEMLSQMLIFGLAVAAFLYTIHLVFLVFTLSTPFYRETFCKCLGFRQIGIGVTADASPAQTEASQPPQDQDEPE